MHSSIYRSCSWRCSEAAPCPKTARFNIIILSLLIQEANDTNELLCLFITETDHRGKPKASLNACFMRVSCTLNRVPHK